MQDAKAKGVSPAEDDDCIWIGVTDKRVIRQIKEHLDAHGLLNKKKKIDKAGLLYRLYTVCHNMDQLHGLPVSPHTIGHYSLNKKEPSNSYIDTILAVKTSHRGHEFNSKIRELIGIVIPNKWVVYRPMVLFSGKYNPNAWQEMKSEGTFEVVFRGILKSSFFGPGITHAAMNHPIDQGDIMRRPVNIEPIIGDFGPEPTPSLIETPQVHDFEHAFWCCALQNGIYQVWAPRYCMFSRGNVKEKKRILDFGRDRGRLYVLDLYTGIGYFTLSYLRNGNIVFCWEINPWSIEGLKRSLSVNDYKYALVQRTQTFDIQSMQRCLESGVKAFIFHESNQYAYDRVCAFGNSLPISHVNLGLLPSSQASWHVVKRLVSLSVSPLTVHVHENLHTDKVPELESAIKEYYDASVTHIEYVKTFAPDIWHVVFDVLVTPRQDGL